MISTSLTDEEIRNSLTRLHTVFAGDYRPLALCEGARQVGCMRREGDRIYLTFRGSVGSWAELLSCLDLRKIAAGKLGLIGKVHAGLCASFDKIRPSIDDCLASLSNKNLEKVSIVVEGYSRGSALAMLAAAYLIYNYGISNLTVLTYSPLNIFDETAAKEYTKKIKNQWNFVCKGDLVPQWIGPSWLGFFPSGQRIEFSPEDSSSFLDRIQNKAYTHLIRPLLIGSILRFLIPLRLWEIHMPETYDGSVKAFHKIRGRY